jgi:hypothetical protein
VLLKKYAIKFYYKCNVKKIHFNNEQKIFDYLVQNINILAGSEHIQQVLLNLLTKVST